MSSQVWAAAHYPKLTLEQTHDETEAWTRRAGLQKGNDPVYPLEKPTTDHLKRGLSPFSAG